MFLLSGGPISWRSQKQKCVALSTAEAEYIAMHGKCSTGVSLAQTTHIWQNSSIPLTKHRLYCTKTISQLLLCQRIPNFMDVQNISTLSIREKVSNGTIILEYCSTSEMLADILTKGLAREAFCKLRDRCGVIGGGVWKGH